MKRSPLKPGRKPMNRTGFVRASASDRRPLPKLRSSRPRMTPIRKSAQGEECTLRFHMICNWRTDTTVLCHSNLLADGKGGRLKAPDTCAAYGCSACHDVLDGRATRPADMTYETMLELFALGVERTHARLRVKGLMK
jgi:hypothetical protein